MTLLTTTHYIITYTSNWFLWIRTLWTTTHYIINYNIIIYTELISVNKDFVNYDTLHYNIYIKMISVNKDFVNPQHILHCNIHQIDFCE